MDHVILLETERLIIRSMSRSDLDDFYAYRKSEEVMKYQGQDAMKRLECLSFIEKYSGKEFGELGRWVQYGIELKASGVLIGDCAIHLNQDDARIGEIGMTLNPEYQKQGFAVETMRGILNFLFSIPDFHRVKEIVDVENTASIQLLQRLGFRREGHFIENIFFNGKWGSEYQYAMLKSEWKTYS